MKILVLRLIYAPPHQPQTHLLPSLCEGPFKSSSLVTLSSAAWRHGTSYVNDICCLNPQLPSVMALQTIFHGCSFFFLLPRHILRNLTDTEDGLTFT